MATPSTKIRAERSRNVSKLIKIVFDAIFKLAKSILTTDFGSRPSGGSSSSFNEDYDHPCYNVDQQTTEYCI